jgi:hypothetical protein
MTDPLRELGLLRAMAGDLEQYLLSDVVYWTLGGAGSLRDHYPQLSLGSLLLTQARLRAVGAGLQPEAQTELSRLKQQVAGLRQRWRANWVKKAEKEVEVRANAWARAAQERSSADYPGQVQSRLMLGLLLDDLAGEASPALASGRSRVAALDALLRNRFAAGPFALDPDLQPAFPRDSYWFLYGRPAEEGPAG